MNVISKIWKSFEKIISYLSGILLAVIIVTMVAQVFLRMAFKYSPAWSEELAQFSFIIMVFLVLNVGVGEGKQLRIDIIDNLIHGWPHLVLEVLRNLLPLGVQYVLISSAWMLLQNGKRITSAGLHLNMSIIYSAVVIGFVLCAVQLAIRTYKAILAVVKMFKEGSKQ